MLLKAVKWSHHESDIRAVDGNRQVSGPANTADAERLVACWNACQKVGISTEDLHAGLLGDWAAAYRESQP